jgi:microcystin-dependent protein
MQFTDITGAPLVGGFLYTYVAGTTTPLATYTDNSGTSLNSNPVVLNARGEANVWLGANVYKFKLTDSNNNEIWTVDNISAPISSISPVLSGNVEISTDSASPALKITQVGAGAALLVQDSADPDSSPFVITSSGNVGFSTLSPTSEMDLNQGTFNITDSGTIYTSIYASSVASVIDAKDNRSLSLQTNSVGRLTLTNTLATFGTPVSIPNNPASGLYAANRNYVDTAANNVLAVAAPTGSVMAFAGGATPTGWLLCAGTAVSRTTYAALYAVIGDTWGAGDGSTTFNVPDLQGAFLRGAGAGNNPSPRAVGSYEADGNQSHTHTATQPDHAHTSQYPALSSQVVGGSTVAISYFTGGTTSPATSGVSGGAPAITVASQGGAQTTPRNYAVGFMIKT